MDKYAPSFLIFLAVALGLFPFLKYFNLIFNNFFLYVVFFGNTTDFAIFRRTMPHFQYGWLVVLFLGAIFCGMLGITLLFIPLLIAMLLIPSFLVRASVASWKGRIRSQLPSFCMGLANSTRAGITIEKSFQEVIKDLASPIREEVALIVGNYRSGMDFRQCLEEAKKTIDLPIFSLIVAAIQTCKDRGGPINLTLEKLGEGVREMERLERNMDSATTLGKKQIQFLSFFPFGFLLLLLLLYEGTTYMFTTLWGQFLILISITIVAIANYWAHAISQTKSTA